jgi:hypothetical protein
MRLLKNKQKTKSITQGKLLNPTEKTNKFQGKDGIIPQTP